jgi:hypothetical protein
MRTLSGEGHTMAIVVGASAILSAEMNWLENGCVKIEAAAPGQVEPGSQTIIPVKVVHVKELAELPLKVTAELSGGKSLDPLQIPQSPGTLTFTAPDEKGQNATIRLSSVSRRGRAILELPATTARASMYHITGTLGSDTIDGVTCDSSQIWSIEGTLFVMFTPADEKSGQILVSQETTFGNGTYVIRDDGTMGVEVTLFYTDKQNAGQKDFRLDWKAVPADPAECQ